MGTWTDDESGQVLGAHDPVCPVTLGHSTCRCSPEELPSLDGLLGRYQVRAGLSPWYEEEDALDDLVKDILEGWEFYDLAADDRGLLAAAAIRGWVEARTP